MQPLCQPLSSSLIQHHDPPEAGNDKVHRGRQSIPINFPWLSGEGYSIANRKHSLPNTKLN